MSMKIVQNLSYVSLMTTGPLGAFTFYFQLSICVKAKKGDNLALDIHRVSISCLFNSNHAVCP